MTGVRGSPGTGRFVEDALRAIRGVLDVKADPVTGSVAILYEPHPTVVQELRPEPRASAPTLLPALPARARPPGLTLAGIMGTVVVVALEIALQRVLGPLFGTRRC